MCRLQVRDHPFKTSALFRGGGVSPLPMFVDSRGVGVSGMPMSAISIFLLKYYIEYLFSHLKIYLFSFGKKHYLLYRMKSAISENH